MTAFTPSWPELIGLESDHETASVVDEIVVAVQAEHSVPPPVMVKRVSLPPCTVGEPTRYTTGAAAVLEVQRRRYALFIRP